MFLTMVFFVRGWVGLRNGWMGGRRDGGMGGWVDGGMGEWVGLRVGFININDMYNNDVGKWGVRVYEAYEVK
jgi:hypothetical protein